MHLLFRTLHAAATVLAAAAAFGAGAAQGAGEHAPCVEDAMIVFDASGSMSGNGWGYGSETAGMVSRIDKVRSTLAKILPNVTRLRRVGLITYGPGIWNQCNVHLDLAPAENAAARILAVVNAIVPAGKTPLTAAVAQAAQVLDFRVKPGLIVVLTDGEETCGGSPCGLGKELSGEAAQLWPTRHASDFALFGGARELARIGLGPAETYGGVAYALPRGWGSSLEAGYTPESLFAPRRYALTGQVHTALRDRRALSVGIQHLLILRVPSGAYAPKIGTVWYYARKAAKALAKLLAEMQPQSEHSFSQDDLEEELNAEFENLFFPGMSDADGSIKPGELMDLQSAYEKGLIPESMLGADEEDEMVLETDNREREEL